MERSRKIIRLLKVVGILLYTAFVPYIIGLNVPPDEWLVDKVKLGKPLSYAEWWSNGFLWSIAGIVVIGVVTAIFVCTYNYIMNGEFSL